MSAPVFPELANMEHLASRAVRLVEAAIQNAGEAAKRATSAADELASMSEVEADAVAPTATSGGER